MPIERIQKLGLLAALLALVGCDVSADPKVGSKVSSTPDVYVIDRPPVEASNLIVNDFYLAQASIRGALVASMYLTTSGTADNVEVSACYDGSVKDSQGKEVAKSGCDPIRKEVTTRFAFAPFPNGKVVFKVRACVAPERALTPGVLCGVWKEKEWMQPPNENSALNELLAQYASIQAELAEMGGNVKDALKEFEKQVGTCASRQEAGQNLLRVRNIVMGATQLSGAVVSRALSGSELSFDGGAYGLNLFAAVGQEGSLNQETIANLPVEELSDSVWRNVDAIDIRSERGLEEPVRTFRSSRVWSPSGGYGSFAALQAIVGAGLEIATASTQVDANRPCLAQSRASSLIEVTNARVFELRARLKAVQAQIKAAGG